MTDNEIIKALECCSTEIYVCDIEECPFKDSTPNTISECRFELVKLALDLINRQKAEIERLKEQVNLWQEEAGSVGCENEWLKASLKEKNAEIEKLKLITTSNPYCVSIGTANIFTENHEEYECLLAKISAEAIKEFAERLKPKLSYYDEEVVDNLVKEMVGESNV